MKKMDAMLTRAWLNIRSFLKSEKGMTTVEIVLLIAVAVVVIGLLSGFLQDAVKQVFEQVTNFIGGGGSGTGG